jgi:uncharacterized RDD family membrane protein YckC
MTGPEPGGSPAPESPQPSAWQPAPPPGPPKDPGPAPGVAYSDLRFRVLAYIIDAVIVGVLNLVVSVLLLDVGLAFGDTLGWIIGLVFVTAFNVAFSALYFIYSWTKLRASPGQKILGLETLNAADGATLTQPQAIRRWLILFGPFALLSALQVVVGGTLGNLFSLASLGYGIYLLWTTYKDPKRQGFHDHFAATVVTRRSA